MLVAPDLDVVLQLRSHKGRVGWDDHLPHPAGHVSFEAVKDIVGLLGLQTHTAGSRPAFCPSGLWSPFSAALISLTSLNLHIFLGLHWSRCNTLHLLLLNPFKLPWAYFSSLSRSIWMNCSSMQTSTDCTQSNYPGCWQRSWKALVSRQMPEGHQLSQTFTWTFHCNRPPNLSCMICL